MSTIPSPRPVRLSIRFADSTGRRKPYTGPDENLKGSRVFGRAYERIANEAINWFVQTTLSEVSNALKYVMVYLGDYAAELVKKRLVPYGEVGAVHVFTGSMMESIEHVEDTDTVSERIGSVSSKATRVSSSLAFSFDVGVDPNEKRYERGGYVGPGGIYAATEPVRRYAYEKMHQTFAHQDIANEIRDVLLAGSADPMNWATTAIPHIVSEIARLRAENQEKIYIAAQNRMNARIKARAGSA